MTVGREPGSPVTADRSTVTEGTPSSGTRILVYYFAFPHYRLSILRELTSMPGARVRLVSGSRGRASIKTLSEADLPGLRTTATSRIGPFTWDHGVLGAATSRRWEAVVVGPAVTSLTTWAVLVSRRLTGRATYLWGQCGRFHDRSVKRLLQELMNRLATGLLVYGRSEAGSACEWGTPPRKVHVVNNATDPNSDWLTDANARSAIERLRHHTDAALRTGHLRILFVGRVVDDKRIDVLLEAGRRLRETFEELRIDLVGDGPAREALMEEYAEPWIHFHGWLYDGPDRNELFREATLVVSPFHMGLLAVDALRFAVPVLVPDNPRNGSEVEALTTGVNALRFEAGSASALGAAVTQWLELAGTIDEQDYLRSRHDALTTWEPREVAKRIVQAVTSRTPATAS